MKTKVNVPTLESIQKKNRERAKKKREFNEIIQSLNTLFPKKNIYIFLEDEDEEFRTFDVKVFDPSSVEEVKFLQENKITYF